MSAPIPSSVYAAVAERLGLREIFSPFWDDDIYSAEPGSDLDNAERIVSGDYTGPTDAAEFLHAVREPMRALDDATQFRIGRQLVTQYSACPIYPRYSAELPFVWFMFVCTPEQQVRALAAAMGIEVGDE